MGIVQEVKWPESPDSLAGLSGICRKGKDRNRTLFWYGSSALLRTDALFQVAAERGMPEAPVRIDTLAEDYDTSVGLTRESNAGWKVCYLDDYLSIGIQPETLLRYFKQQRRWILGSAQVVNKRLIPIIPQLLKNGEYEQAATILVDTLYRISPLQSFLFASSALGFAMLPTTGSIPHILLASGLATFMVFSNWSVYFYRGLKRGCKFSDILRNLDLHGMTAPVYLEAAARSLSSKKAAFETTNVAKIGHERIPLKWLLPNLAILGTSMAALFYILGDAIMASIDMISVGIPLLIFKSLWMLNNIRCPSRIAEFNDGWKETLSDLLEGIKQATNPMQSSLQTKFQPLAYQLRNLLLPFF